MAAAQESKVKVAVIGVGGVGTAFLSQLAAFLPAYPHVHVALISRSSKALTSSHPHKPIALDRWPSDLDASAAAAPPAAEVISFLTSAPGPAVLVDNTSNAKLAGHYPQFLISGISVITPNKKAFSGPQFLWDAIYAAARGPAGGLVYHESTVGAGLPVLCTLNDLVRTGDRIDRIEGVFSGTMSFLFNSFMPGVPTSGGGKAPKWSAIVKQAKERGYTEPDPREDLTGLDVARKLVILARAAGASVAGTDAFPIKSLIPGPLEGVSSADDFMARLAEFDGEMEALRADAQKEGKVLRYNARMQRPENGETQLEVKMEGVPIGSPLAGLEGADNMFCFYTKRYGDTPLIVRGAGAGAEVTAMGVMSDLIRVLERLH